MPIDVDGAGAGLPWFACLLALHAGCWLLGPRALLQSQMELELELDLEKLDLECLV